MSYTEDELIASAREHALAGLLSVVGMQINLRMRASLSHHFQSVLNTIDHYRAERASPVTPQQLGEDVLDACAGEGWDTTLLFWDDTRYDDNDEEVPSEIAANIAARLLERYEMKART